MKTKVIAAIIIIALITGGFFFVKKKKEITINPYFLSQFKKEEILKKVDWLKSQPEKMKILKKRADENNSTLNDELVKAAVWWLKNEKK